MKIGRKKYRLKRYESAIITIRFPNAMDEMESIEK
jgi:hypothetical protein